MNEIKTFDYNGQKLRITLIEGRRWYALYDVSAIIKASKAYYSFAQKLSDEEKKIIIVNNDKRHGGSRMIFINETSLYVFLNRAYRPESVKFKTWLKENFPDCFNSEIEVQAKATSKPSIQASLQKAQMLIRIAENKAVPYSEQLRLLDLAAKELTGVGLNLDAVPKVKPIICVEIMDLPEVVGVVNEKETKIVNGVEVDYLTADMMAKKWRNPNDRTFGGKDFSELADEYGYKAPKFGYWKRVMTPDGEAREFMYFDGTMLDYMNKKFGRVA